MNVNKVCWNLTRKCNYRCKYCFRELFEHDLSLDENYEVLNSLKNLGVKTITFSGGEPFLYKYILLIMKRSRELGITNNIITNGSKLNKDNIKDYLKYVDKITFSVDSPNDYDNLVIGRYDNSMDTGTYEHIRLLISMIRMYYPDLPIEINSVIVNDPSHNYRELEEMKDALDNDLAKYGVKKWKLLRFYGLRGSAREISDLYDVSDEDFEMLKSKYGNDSSHEFSIELRDHNSFDDEYIVSPRGLLVRDNNLQESVLLDLLENKREYFEEEEQALRK